MGYWSTHPMAGDTPLDYRNNIDFGIYTEDEWYATCEDPSLISREEIKNRWEKKLPKFIEIFEGEEKEGSFVLPFEVVAYQIIIKDKNLSERVKNMIGDGGAKDRGYDCPVSNKENNYNDFKSPNDYACQLRNNWDDLMDGKISFESLEREVSLIETMVKHKEANKSGLVNCK